MFAWQATAQDELGTVIFEPSITVYEEDGVTLADIYSDNIGTPKLNPFIGTEEGFVQFWAESGKYKVLGASGVNTTEVWDISITMEILDAVAAAEASAAAAIGGSASNAEAAAASAVSAAASAVSAAASASTATTKASEASASAALIGSALLAPNSLSDVASKPKALATLRGFTSTATAAGTTTLTNTSTYFQRFAGTAAQTVVLPVATTLVAGWAFEVENASIGVITVNSSGGNLVAKVPPASTLVVRCVLASETTAASWSVSGVGNINDLVPVEAFGAVADGVTDSTLAFQNAAAFILATGRSVAVGLGTYIVTATVTLNYTTSISGKGGFIGKGLSQSEIFSNVTGTTPVFHITGTWGSSEQLRSTVSGIGLRSESNAGVGWHFENISYVTLDRISAQGFNRGFKGTNVICPTFRDCMFVSNNVGLEGLRNVSSGPNAWLLQGCTINGSTTLAMLMTKGATCTIIGGTVEGNGTHATADNGGIYINGLPDEGAQSLTAIGVYFEGNGGTGDIIIDCNDGDSANVTVTGCTFNRISSSKFVTNNIAIKKTGVGPLNVTATGNGFCGFNTYVASAARRYVGVVGTLTGAVYAFNIHDNFYASDTERPNLAGPRASDSAYASAWVRFLGATAAVSFSHNVASVSRTAAGRYRITFSQQLRAAGHCVVGSAVGTPHHVYLVNEATTYVDIETLNTAGALADPPAVSVAIYSS